MTEFDGSTHFDALLSDANLHASFAFRSQAEIDAHTVGSTPNPWITFDPSMNAAKVVTPPGDGASDAGIPVGAQLRPTFPLVDKTTGDTEISFQWEARWSSHFLDVKQQGLTNQKSFMISRADVGGDTRRIEFNTNFNRTDATAVGAPSLRDYLDGPTGGAGHDGSKVIRSANLNHQPGGPGYTTWNSTHSALEHLQSPNGPFLILVDKWIRFTASMTFTGGEQRVRVWLQHEDEQAATLVIADDQDTSRGFLIDGSGTWPGTDNFWFEFNSSNVRLAGTPALEAWVRNLVVFKNSTVPLKTGKTMATATQTSTISIAPGPLVITSVLPPDGKVGQAYHHKFEAMGGTPPYKWKRTRQLTPGLALVGDVLSGKPTTAGDYTATTEVQGSGT